jgi:lipopolysaccharide export system permease protein
MRVLDRYLLREIAVHFVAVTGVLFVILVSFQIGKVLSQAADNQFPRDVVVSLIGLTSIRYLKELVPLGMFLAAMLALGRLYHDSEISALQAAGLGVRRLLRPVFLLGVAVAALLAWLAFWVAPSAAGRAEQLRVQAIREARLAGLEPQHFGSFAGGDVVYYAESVDSAGVLYNVFVQRRVGDKVSVTLAKRAEQLGIGEVKQTFLLYDGEHYEGIPGSGQFRISRFAEFGYPIELPTATGRGARIEAKPTQELLPFEQPADRAELEGRLAAPLMALVLTILAAPLSRLRPRQGRYAKIGLALLAYFLYLVALNTTRVWVEKQTALGMLGQIWVHGVALAFAAWLLFRQDPPAFMLRAAKGTA